MNASCDFINPCLRGEYHLSGGSDRSVSYRKYAIATLATLTISIALLTLL
ncbi:MAG: hypothetical protein WCO29_08275 [Nostocales cyanobacterium ELA583]